MRTLFSAALAGLAASGTVHAAGVVSPNSNPGNVLKQQLQNLEKNTPGATPGPGTMPPVLSAPQPKSPPLKLGPGVQFVLKGITIGPSAFLKPAELKAIYLPYIGKTIQFSDLQKIVEEINALYRAKGVVTARAVLPPQRIVNGVVRIELVEGKIGRVKIEGNSITRSSYILRRINVVPGQVVDAKKLENELIYFNRTNQTQLHASLHPGASFGLTDILLRAREPAPADLYLFADNEGVAATGANVVGAYLRDNKILGLGDNLEAYVLKSSGSTTGNVLYNIPVNTLGGTLGVSYARGHINIVSGPEKSLGISGNSSTAGVHFIQPVYVTKRWKVSGAFELARDTSDTSISGVSLGTTYVDKGSVGIRAQYIAPTRYALFALSATPQHTRGAGGKSSATVYNGSFSLIQRLPKSLGPYSVALKGAVQYANHWRIAPQELFVIGGVYSVRGYSQGLFSGTCGYYAQLELHRSLPHHIDGFLFTDTGAVYNQTPRLLSISSAGAGLSWAWHGMSTSFILGYAANWSKFNQDRYRANLRIALNIPI